MIFSILFSVLSRLGLLVLTIVSVKLLTVKNYGEFSYFLNIINTFILFSSAGTGVSTNIAISEHFKNNNKHAMDVVGFNLALVVILSILVWITFLGFYLFIDSNFSLLLISIIGLIVIVSSNINVIYENIYMGLGEFFELARNAVYIFIVAVISIVFLVWEYGVTGALFAYALYRVISLVINFLKSKVKLKDINFSLKSKSAQESFKKIGLPSFMSSLMVGPVIGLAITITLLNTSYEQIAYFSWIFQIYMVAIFIPSALGGFFLHVLSQEKSKIKEKISKLTVINFILSSLVCIFLLIGKKYILSYAGKDFLIYANQLYIYMVFAVVFYSINTVFSSVWPTINKAWIGVALNLIWAATLLLLVFFLSHLIGVTALGLSFLLSYIVLFVIQFLLYFKYIKQINLLNGEG